MRKTPRIPTTSATAALATAAAVLALGASAQAATVSVEGSAIRVVAAPGEANQVSFTAPTPDSVSVTDAGAPLAAGPGCVATDVVVTCVTPENPSIDVSASDGDDSVTLDAAVPAFVDAGPGNDAVDVADGVGDSVWCSRGRDSVTADLPAAGAGPADFLDLGCERVDYGAPGAVGRLAWRTGGGRLVEVPGQTWARVDRRILPDVLHLVRRYHLQIWEGFGTIGHEPFGEHPLGLAVDILPGAGGTWDDVSRLARWAEPRQDHPRGPFRWVGWNGDFNHGHPSVCKPRLGCAPHLHLSWSHSPTAPRNTARTVRVFQVLKGQSP